MLTPNGLRADLHLNLLCFWYLCYYPHLPRGSVSLICRIFVVVFMAEKRQNIEMVSDNLEPKESRSQETKNLSTAADSSIDNKKILPVRQNLLKKQTFFARQSYNFYEPKFSNLKPFFSLLFPQEFQKFKKFGHWTLGIGSKVNKWKIRKRLFHRGNFTPFMSKSFQIWDQFFTLLFPKDSKSLENLEVF